MKLYEKINKLTLIRLLPPRIRTNGRKRPMGVFRCDCGDESEKTIYSVSSGHIKQCLICANKGRKKPLKHGLINHPLYRKWCDMKKRCYNPNVDRFPNYGALGIIVCDDWKNNFKSFYDWSIDNGWEKGLTIDRKDVLKNYTPDNCRYITLREQHFNKRNTFYVEINNQKISLTKFLYIIDRPKLYGTIRAGLKSGKNMEYYIKKYNIKNADEISTKVS